MKKIFSVLLLFVMLLLVGCQAAPISQNPNNEETPFVPPAPYTKQYSYPANMNFRILDTGVVTDGGMTGVGRKTEYTLPWEQPLLIPWDTDLWKKTISIGDRTIEGQRIQDQQSLYQHSPSIGYTVGQEYNFSIHATKGHLTEFTDHEKMKNLAPVEASAAITETEAIAVASDFLDEIVDVSEYTITCENRETYYIVHFIKYFNGVESIDKAFTYVSMTGEVVHYYAYSLGELDDLTLNISVEDADAAVLAKMEELYDKHLAQCHEAEITINSKRVILFEDGTLALLYDMKIVALTHKSYGKSGKSDLAQFVICENDITE